MDPNDATGSAIADGGPSSPRLKVFISYSRRDMVFADRLVAALTARGFEVLIDRRDLPKLEDWRRELLGFIRQADTVVFIVSHHSLASEVVGWEIEQVRLHSKRLAPVVIADVDVLSLPYEISRINHIQFRDDGHFEQDTDELARALGRDVGWLKEHTRLGEVARRWAEHGKTESNLLRGEDIDDADKWAARRPKDAPVVTELQREFIFESRQAEQRRRRNEVFRSRAVAAGSLAAVVIVSLLGWSFYESSREALASQSLFLADVSQQQLKEGDAVTAQLLAMEALPDPRADHVSQRLRPHLQSAELMLDLARRQQGDENWAEIAVLSHPTSVYALAISPDSQSVVTTSYTSAYVWNLKTGERTAILPAHQQSVVAFSPDGKLVATGGSSDGTAKIWETRTAREVYQLGGHAGSISALAFSRDGKTLVTGSDDGTARVWDVESGLVKHVLEGHTARIFKLDVAASDSRVATSSHDRTARIWDLETGRQLHVFNHPGELRTVRFSPQGTSIATCGSDRACRIFDVASGAEVLALKGHKAFPWKIAFSPDGLLLAVLDDTAVRLWSMHTGEEVWTFRGHSKGVRDIAFSAGGELMATAAADDTVRVWDVRRRSSIAILSVHQDLAHIAAFTPDGTYLVTGSFDGTVRIFKTPRASPFDVHPSRSAYLRDAAFSPDGRMAAVAEANVVHLWDLASRNIVRTFEGHEAAVRALSFSSSGREIITASADGTARIWSVRADRAALILRGHSGPVLAIALSPDGRYAATASVDQTARIWATQDGASLQVLNTYQTSDEGSFFPALAFSPDSTRLAFTAASARGQPWTGFAHVWQVPSGQPLLRLRGTRSEKMYVSPDFARVVSVSWDFSRPIESEPSFPILWDATTGKLVAEIGSGRGPPLAVAFSHDGKLVAIPTDPVSSIRIVETSNGRLVTTLRGHTADVLSLAFSADARRLLSSAADGEARVWDVTSGIELATLRLRNHHAVRVGFSLDENTIVTGSSDGAIRFWNAKTFALFSEVRAEPDWINELRFSRDGAFLLSSTRSGVVRLWRVPADEHAVIDQLKSGIPRCLTPKQRASFHLPATAPRWCFKLKKWPYADPSQPEEIPPPYSFEERLLAVYDAVVSAIVR